MGDPQYESMIQASCEMLMTSFYKALYTFNPNMELVKAATIECIQHKKEMNNEIIHSSPENQVKKNKELLDMENYIKKTDFKVATV